jgi:acetyl/propionyl-CoA carboxylase alpha subunit
VVDGTRIDATATREGLYSLKVATGGRVRSVGIAAIDATAESGAMELTLDGLARKVGYAVVSQTVVLFIGGEAVELVPPRPGAGAAALEAGDAIVAPMPGKVLQLRAKAGDALDAGQVVLVLEAMKMEHALAAPRAGVLQDVNVAAGAQVAQGDVLARLEPLDGDA